jgi:hypothetical protein
VLHLPRVFIAMTRIFFDRSLTGLWRERNLVPGD